MIKATTMDAVMNYEFLDGEGTVFDEVLSNEGLEALLNSEHDEDEDETILLPKVQIVVGTKALQCGVSGNLIKHAFKKEFPGNLYELVQELGRVDRLRNAEPETNTYEVHVSFASYISLFIRIMQNADAKEGSIQLSQLAEVVEFLVVPSKCYHSVIEDYFERYEQSAKSGCGSCCSFCLGENNDFTGKVYKKSILHVLLTKLFGKGKAPTCPELISALKSGKDKIFHPDNMPSKNMGQIHGLALQLLAKGIIGLDVVDKSKIGTKQLGKKNLVLKLLNADDDGMSMPAYLLTNAFDGMNII